MKKTELRKPIHLSVWLYLESIAAMVNESDRDKAGDSFDVELDDLYNAVKDSTHYSEGDARSTLCAAFRLEEAYWGIANEFPIHEQFQLHQWIASLVNVLRIEQDFPITTPMKERQ